MLILLFLISVRTIYFSSFVRNISKDELCTEKLNKIAESLENHGIIANEIQFTGTRINDLGQYKQCINLSSSRYIMLTVRHINSINEYIGLCLPIECRAHHLKKESIAEIASDLIGKSILPEMINLVDAKEAAQEKYKITPATFVAIASLMILLILCIIGSCINDDARSSFSKVLGSFNIRKNASALLYSENKIDHNLDVLNGVRVLSIGWVILSHTIKITRYSPLLNSEDLYASLKSYWISFILAGHLAVDTCFCISGFLASLSLTQLFQNKSKINPLTIFIAIIKRLIRLYPLYIATFLIIYHVVPLMEGGPIYDYNSWLTENCNKNWWTNILFINNFEKASKQCLGWTWYIAIDMQFFILTIPITILYTHKKSLGIVLTLILMGGSLITIFLIVFINVYPVNPLAYRSTQGTNAIYYKPWTRVSTYLIGVLFAWLYLSNKNEKYRTKFAIFVSRVWTSSYAIRYFLYLIGITSVTFWVFSYAYFFRSENPKAWFNIVYYTFSNTCFTLGMMLMIFPILIGRGKPLLYILGHQMFNFLSKISFGVYMLHVVVCSLYFSWSPQGIEYRVLLLVTCAIDVFMLTSLLSFVVVLVLESPILNLSKILFEKAFEAKARVKQLDDESAILKKSST